MCAGLSTFTYRKSDMHEYNYASGQRTFPHKRIETERNACRYIHTYVRTTALMRKHNNRHASGNA